jgi:hypothetical protein
MISDNASQLSVLDSGVAQDKVMISDCVFDTLFSRRGKILSEGLV